MELVRAFIAIELPEELKSALTRWQGQLQKASPTPAKWVNPDSIHLTLKFFGNITVSQVGEITKVMETAARGITPFHLEVGGLGAFPNLRRVQVVWVGVSGDLDRLKELQKRLDAGLAPLGFPPEARAFTPHLTLARIRDYASPEQRQMLGEIITSTRIEANFGFDVDSANLMRSQLTREGAIYTRLFTVKLKEN